MGAFFAAVWIMAVVLVLVGVVIISMAVMEYSEEGDC